jgi:hypothetical protein
MQHPSEDLLLRYDSQPDRISAVARSSVEMHLKTCPSCRDELRALRGFDFSVLQQPVADHSPTPLPARSEQQAWWKGFFAPVRTVLLHPAFAYGLVVLLLLPSLANLATVGSPVRQAAFVNEQPEREVAAAPPAVSSDGGRDALHPGARQDEPASARLPKEAQPEPASVPVGRLAPGEAGSRVRDKASDERVERLADTAPADHLVAKKREVDSLRARQVPEEAGFEEHKDANGPASQLGLAQAFRDDTRDEKRDRDERRVLVIEMDRSGRNNLPVRDLLDGATMRIKPQQPIRLGSEVAIRIKSADGRREMREIQVAERDDGYLEMTIPPGWMADGRYSVELLPLGQIPQAPPPHHHEAVR